MGRSQRRGSWEKTALRGGWGVSQDQLSTQDPVGFKFHSGNNVNGQWQGDEEAGEDLRFLLEL